MPHSYQLLARTEPGEVSELYRGLQDRTREVALKLFSPRLSDPDYGRALMERSRQVAALGQPALLHHEEVGTVEGRLCCVRAHVEGYHLGTALSRLSSKEVVLPAAVAVQLAVEVLLALGAAHQAGLAHGALTPANIIVGRDGRVRVTDFGALAAMRESALLRPLADRGRRSYRAPELAKNVEADPGSDVYSVAAILYELLTLHEVGASRSGGVSTRRDELVPPSRLDRRVNARLDPLLLRALDPLRSRRHRDGVELAEALAGFLSATGAPPGPGEIARFVKELFPNEVNLAGSTADLPLTRTFTLEPVGAGASLPGLPIEVAERASYTTSSLEAVVLPADAPPSRAEEKTTSDPLPPRAISEWDAPPGALDPAVARRFSDPARLPIEVQDTGPLPRLPPQRPPPRLADPETQTDIPTNPVAPKELLGGAELSPTVEARRPRPAAIRPPRRDTPPPPVRPERPDWHVKYQPPPPAPPVKTPSGAWVAAVAMALVAAGLTFLAVSHRTRGGPPSLPRHDEPAPRAAAPTPAVHHDPPARRPVPAAPLPVRAPSYCLTLSANVPNAVVDIDGTSTHRLPLEALPVPPGDHLLVVSAPGHAPVRLTMGEAFTRAPCVARVVPLARGR